MSEKVKLRTRNFQLKILCSMALGVGPAIVEGGEGVDEVIGISRSGRYTELGRWYKKGIEVDVRRYLSRPNEVSFASASASTKEALVSDVEAT